ncbi:Cytochrome c oxidase polypeptide VIb [Paragonimus heterotremus]|uniref:Cytochrome c oxidase polypeptide VIb n=1 Tax=Paragonimus heterotremus TaxID=100268 RepID=A0A8J4SSU9_9TREM|nr:Cytochrome c oxidase polypeptide VIb [Paragonimus heterotremus]
MKEWSDEELQVYKRKAQESKKTGDYSWITVPPYDSRFPNVNQTPNCRQNFIDYFRCKRLYGDEYPPCNYFHRMYTLLCPKIWIEEWEAQVADGTYPYRDRIAK